jgi:hypothetical protein
MDFFKIYFLVHPLDCIQAGVQPFNSIHDLRKSVEACDCKAGCRQTGIEDGVFWRGISVFCLIGVTGVNQTDSIVCGKPMLLHVSSTLFY